MSEYNVYIVHATLDFTIKIVILFTFKMMIQGF